jgi:hypothetical protein
MPGENLFALLTISQIFISDSRSYRSELCNLRLIKTDMPLNIPSSGSSSIG